jgi:hypothetical protein
MICGQASRGKSEAAIRIHAGAAVSRARITAVNGLFRPQAMRPKLWTSGRGARVSTSSAIGGMRLGSIPSPSKSSIGRKQ